MKINLKNLETLQRVIHISCFKTGDKRKDSMYFDFKREVLVFHNERFNGEINFSFQKDEEEKVVNFFVDLTKFFYVLKEMNSESVTLIFEEKDGTFIPVFKNGSDIYKISYIISEEEDLELEFIEEEYKKINFSSETIKLMDQASIFVDQQEIDKFNSVSLSTDNKVFGLTTTRFFSSNISETLEDELFIHKDLTKVLSSLTINFDFFYDERKFILKNDYFRFIYSVRNSHSVIPTEDQIKSVSSKDFYFSLNKKSFLDLLKFFDPFYVSDSKPIRFEVVSKKELKVSTVSSYDVVEKLIDFSEELTTEDLLGYSAKFNGSIIKNALSVFDSDSVMFFASFEKNGLLISDSISPTKEVVVLKYKEDTE